MKLTISFQSETFTEIRNESNLQLLSPKYNNHKSGNNYDMYNRDSNNNTNYLLTDNKNHLYPKGIADLSKEGWIWKEKRPLGSHTTNSPLIEEGNNHVDPLKFSSNNYKEVINKAQYNVSLVYI